MKGEKAQKPKKGKGSGEGRIQRFDEANVARLGLISIQERIPDDFTSWVVERDLDGRTQRLECVAPAEFGGVPHGLDGDIANALIDLYLEQGAPLSGEIHTTAYRLLHRAGLTDDGRHYQRLNQSLFRLRGATTPCATAGSRPRSAAMARWPSATWNRSRA